MKQEYKFFFKNQLFTSEEEFWKKVNNWQNELTTADELDRFIDDFNKNIQVNLKMHDYPFTNSEMSSFFSDCFINFCRLLNKKNNEK